MLSIAKHAVLQKFFEYFQIMQLLYEFGSALWGIDFRLVLHWPMCRAQCRCIAVHCPIVFCEYFAAAFASIISQPLFMLLAFDYRPAPCVRIDIVISAFGTMHACRSATQTLHSKFIWIQSHTLATVRTTYCSPVITCRPGAAKSRRWVFQQPQFAATWAARSGIRHDLRGFSTSLAAGGLWLVLGQ